MDLATDDPKVSIDARLSSNVDNPAFPACFVMVTRSTDYYTPLEVPFIRDAVITLTDDTGQLDTLEYITLDTLGPEFGFPVTSEEIGVYLSTDFVAAPGRQYTLQVRVGDQIYEATEPMREKLPLDSLTYEYKDIPPVYDPGYYFTLHADEPQGTGNFYLIQFYLNDTLQNAPDDIQLADDEFVDGNYIRAELFRPFESGDTIDVEFHHITQSMYDFQVAHLDIVQGSGTPFSAPPANPPSNFSNGALGLFWVSAPVTRRIIIPEED